MAEIKISELSIGDWINQKINDGAYQVQWIEREKVGLIKYTGTEEDGSIRLTAVPLSFIEPIPLTPEILEKNGFRKLDRFNEYVIGEWDSNPFIAVRLAEKFVEPTILVKNGGTSAHLFGSRGEYVHQLQNALRLAGVEKEIEL